MTNVNQVFERAFELANKHCGADATHAQDHILRVLNIAEYLAKKEHQDSQIDMESLKLACIFHDLGSNHRIKKLKRNTNKFKSEEHARQSFIIARDFLIKEGFSKAQIDKVERIITSHGNNGLKDDPEGHLLHDADLLDGIGLAGTLRIFTFGGQIGRDVLGSLEFTKLKINNRQFRTKSGQTIGKKRIKKVKKLLNEVDTELQNTDLI